MVPNTESLKYKDIYIECFSLGSNNTYSDSDDVKTGRWKITNKNGDVFYFDNLKCHRENDPAVILKSGQKFYYQHGKLHNTKGEAVTGYNIFILPTFELKEVLSLGLHLPSNCSRFSDYKYTKAKENITGDNIRSILKKYEDVNKEDKIFVNCAGAKWVLISEEEKIFFLEGIRYTEEEWNKRINEIEEIKINEKE